MYFRGQTFKTIQFVAVDNSVDNLWIDCEQAVDNFRFTELIVEK